MSFFKIDVVEIPFHVIMQEEEVKIDLGKKDFGGSLLNPNFIYNPMFVIDVLQTMSYQIKLEFSNHLISSMACLIGVDAELTDIRQANYSYFLKQANPGIFSTGVSELNCQLEVGRYILICSIQNPEPVVSSMRVYVSSFSNQLSDHPQVFNKPKPNSTPSFSI